MDKIERDVLWSAIEGRTLRLIRDHLETLKVDNREDLLDKEEAIRRVDRMLFRNVPINRK